MTDNVHLAGRMSAAGLSRAELAKRLNTQIEWLTGRPGTLQVRHIRNWLGGNTRWPQERQRRALEAEFGVSAEELGFIRPARSSAHPDSAPEDPVDRRHFTAGAVSFAAATLLSVPDATARPRVGMSDVDALEQRFSELVAADNTTGGTITLETRALAFAHHALERINVGTASTRVKNRLYASAAAFTGTALWSAIDAREPERAERHFDRALRYARLAQDPVAELRLWSHQVLLSGQRLGGRSEALAAAEAGRSSAACRRDPLYRSLATARLAGAQAQVGEYTSALRSLDHARTSLRKADPAAQRPSWIGFYDEAELNGLTALVMEDTGRHAEAEAFLHMTLTRLRPDLLRNKAYYSATLALIQLRQGEIERACTTALTVLPEDAGDSLAGRTRTLLHTFHRELAAVAPNTRSAVEWTNRYT
ncbi:XRE family transcriptional regulator, partial [Streptomyces sp. NPDC059956]|uniref:XRE family transcriptional regulator n=2 Tax=unclassified Streptomyces TaxID=2593676 RepID=UPI0036626ED9